MLKSFKCATYKRKILTPSVQTVNSPTFYSDFEKFGEISLYTTAH